MKKSGKGRKGKKGKGKEKAEGLADAMQELIDVAGFKKKGAKKLRVFLQELTNVVGELFKSLDTESD